MTYEKQNKVWRKYLCRKDWRKREYSLSKSIKKHYRKYASGIVRRYKGDLPSGSAYKKLFDLWWTIY